MSRSRSTSTLVVMVGWVVIGGAILAMASLLTAQEWRANHGHGRPGVYTLTDKNGCTRDERPEDRSCNWSGQFASDDGRVVRNGVSMDLPGVDRQVGDVVRVVDGGFFGEPAVYIEGDTDGWRRNLKFVVPSGVAVLAGLVVLLRPRRRRAAGQPADLGRVS